MDIREVLTLSFDAIKANKLRSILTILGIVIGVFSVISVMTAIGVLENSITTGLNVLGTNTFVIQKYPAIQFGPRSRDKYRNRRDISYDQFKLLKDKNTEALYVSAYDDHGGEIIASEFDKTKPNVTVAGGDEGSLATGGYTLASGRNMSEEDISSNRNVAIIGDEIRKRLFPTSDPLGQTIRVKGQKFTVIGIVEFKGTSFGQSQDNFVYIPITNFLVMYGSDNISIAVMSKSALLYTETVDHITGLMRIIRKVPPGEDEDFEIFSNESLIQSFKTFSDVFSLAAAAISFVALIAAGIGIMNIMLVSVTERTKEIGIRKAIGATRSDILRQFLYEAIVLCQVGGLVGIIVGALFGNIVALIMDIPAQFPWIWAGIGIIVCTIIGVTFGSYPAYKAAQLDPIEALRYE